LQFLIRPLCQADGSNLRHVGSTGYLPLASAGGGCSTLYVPSPLDGLSLRIKITIFGGLVLASPVILFEMWRFITPGLAARERRDAIPFVAAAFRTVRVRRDNRRRRIAKRTWLVEISWVTEFADIYDPIPYLGLVLTLIALFGLTFQFPVVLVSLELANVVTPARLLHSWRWAVILIASCRLSSHPAPTPSRCSLWRFLSCGGARACPPEQRHESRFVWAFCAASPRRPSPET
jgi:Sec-independent protein secretion pathway component TatC